MTKLLLTCCLICCCISIFSQQYSFIQYSRPEGLPQTQISSITQDARGYLWIGTVGGVSCFNGIEFKNYSKANGLLDNQVNCLLVDDANRILLGNNGGISIIDGKSIYQCHFPKELNSTSVRCMLINEGYLYMGSRSNGLFRCPLESLSDTITQIQKIGQQKLRIRDLLLFENKILVASINGLKQVSGTSLTSFKQEFDLLNVGNIASKDEHLWISTIQAGVLHHFDSKTTVFNEENGGIRTNKTKSIIIDNKGNPWVGTRTGLERLKNDVFTSFKTDNGLLNDNIKVVFEDNEGNIWVGSDGAGIFKFSGDRFVALTEDDGIASNLIMSFAENESGMWIGSYGGGISNYFNKEVKNYTSSNMFSSSLIWSSIVDDKNNIWFGTSSGITIKDDLGVHPFLIDRIIDNVRITSLANHNEKIFIGHRDGIAYYYKDSVTHLKQDIKSVRTLLSLPDSSLLVGCANGMYTYKNNTFKKIKIDNEAELYPIYSIAYVDPNHLWVGNSNGLFLISDGSAKKYSLGPSAGHNFINFLLLENDTVLWAGTNHGLNEINIASFTNEDGIIYRNYTPDDGARSYETNLNAAFKSNSGTLWFGTINGALMFDRRNVQTKNKAYVPLLSISQIQLSLNNTNWDNYSTEYTELNQLPVNLKLPHQKNHLTFHFIGVSHSFPKQVKYQTRLDGFDENWNPMSQTRFITYSNLPPGSYTFKVKATINEKTWSKEQSFTFIITPPFWKTWWFINFLTLAGLSIILLIYRSRRRIVESRRTTEKLIYKTRLLNLEQQSLNASMNRHFIFNALNSIQYYINRQDKLAANRYLSSFAKLIRKNLDSSSSPDNLVALSEELERLDLYISLEHMRFQDKFEYEITIDPTIDTSSIRVPAMFLQPYVENSIWHGVLPMKSAGKIEVKIVKTTDEIKFSIEDNGIGIEKSLAKKGTLSHSHDSKGMKITSSRINVLRTLTKRNIQIIGPFEVKDKNDETMGTKVEIVFSLEQNTVFTKIKD